MSDVVRVFHGTAGCHRASFEAEGMRIGTHVTERWSLMRETYVALALGRREVDEPGLVVVADLPPEILEPDPDGHADERAYRLRRVVPPSALRFKTIRANSPAVATARDEWEDPFLTAFGVAFPRPGAHPLDAGSELR